MSLNIYFREGSIFQTIKALFRDIKEAIAGTEQDFTSGSLSKAVFLLAVPMVLEMVMESVFAVVDIWFVSRLGADAVATVGITESLLTIVYSIGIGLSTATTALVSRRIGEKNKEGASNAAFQSIVTAFSVSMLIAIPGLLFAEEILMLMGMEPAVASAYSGYTRIMLGGNVVIMFLFIINAVFRSSGDAAISMRILWIANMLNLVLDPILIFGFGPIPALGIEGAAIATTTGRGLAVAYQFYILFSGKKRVPLSRKNLAIKPKVIFKLIKLSAGGIGQYLIATTSWIFLVRIISEFGSEVVAGYTIAIRVIIFSLLPSYGVSNASATLVGQNLGAKQPERAEKSVWITGIVNMVMMGVAGIVFILFPTPFIRIFIDDPEVIRVGSQALQVISYGFVFYGIGMVLVNSINGAGDTMTPTKINFLSFWLTEIPLAYLLSIQLGMGEEGVFYAIVVAETVMTLMAFYVFRRGKWKLREV
jgi:putative MATE family efflux protein